MLQIISEAFVYLLFSYNLVKQFLSKEPILADFRKYFTQRFNDFVESGKIQNIPFIGYNPLKKPAKKVTFDTSEANFKKVMSEISDDFGGAYQIIREYLLTKEEAELHDVVEWMDKVIEYNVPHGKKNRGLILVASYKYFAPKDTLTEKNIELSCILAWCMEILQASVLIIDDIMDHSTMRRGQRCWYLHEEVGNMAINDALILQHLIFEIMKHYIGKHKCYTEIAELTRITSYQTALGQCVDCLTTPEGTATDFSLLTPARYATIVKYKTSLYSFDLPVRLGMLFAGIKDDTLHSKAQRILIRMGHLFQAQDDLIDCYGDPEITGKVGTDIEDGKCCWVAVEAVIRMNEEQIEEFKEHYGRRSELSVQIIKMLYEKLQMKNVFMEFEDKEYKELRKEIAQFGKQSQIEVRPFYGLLDIIYKRKK